MQAEPCCLPAHLIPNYDDSDDEEATNLSINDNLFRLHRHGDQIHYPSIWMITRSPNHQLSTRSPNHTSEIVEDEEIELSDPMYELLRQQHCKFGHLPFKQSQEMARNRDISKRLANCRVPKCSACMFAKATKRA